MMVEVVNKFILWSFLGELAIGEEMWICTCLISMHSFSSEGGSRKNRHIALHVPGQFKEKNCTEQKWYFLFYLFYFILVFTGLLYRAQTFCNLSQRTNRFILEASQSKTLYSYSQKLLAMVT